MRLTEDFLKLLTQEYNFADKGLVEVSSKELASYEKQYVLNLLERRRISEIYEEYIPDENRLKPDDYKLPDEEEYNLSDEDLKESSPPDIVDTNKLNLLETSVVLPILDECIDYLCILKSALPENIEHRKAKLLYQAPKQRFRAQRSNYELFSKKEVVEFVKVQKDISIILDVLTAACEEIRLKSSFLNLIYALDSMKQMVLDESNILTERKGNLQLVKRLKISLKHERDQHKYILKNKSHKSFVVFENYNAAQENAKLQMRYVEKWETARISQNSMKFKICENKFRNAISDYKNKIELENRIHGELTMFLNETLEDSFEELEKWMTRYDNDLEEREAQIYKMKIKKAELVTKLEKMKDTYLQRQKAIDDWLEEKAKMEAEAERRRKELWAVLVIQPWWRGVMVRKKLGKYAKKKKKNKGKKGGKDKGKKTRGKKK